MPSDIRIKICGLRREAEVTACAEAGVSYIGLNFVPASPRQVTPAEARPLALAAPPGLAKVALVMNAGMDEIARIVDAVPLDVLQLHGAETPEQVEEVKARFGLPVIKAIGIAEAADLSKIDLYAKAADQLLLDAKPPKAGELPGGTGLMFDHRLLVGRRWPMPWMLAGGLTPDTVAEAIRQTGARQVDVSSGVERQKGVKDLDLIAAFTAAAKAA